MNELLSSLCIRQLWNVFNTKVNNHYTDCKEIYLQALYPPSQKKHPMNSIQLQILFWELKKISKEIVNKSRVHCSYTIYYIIPKYLCILILCTYLNLESLNVNILRCLLTSLKKTMRLISSI